MGREIRRVPKNWEHPRYDEKGRWPGHHIPMHDCDFETAAAQWKDDFAAWEDGDHPDLCQSASIDLAQTTEFWEWESPPDPDTCRPKFTSEPACLQVYETVSEGTPVSPVFETEGEMVAWLIAQGHSEHAAREFVRRGDVPSMVMTVPPGGGPPKIAMGIDALDREER